MILNSLNRLVIATALKITRDIITPISISKEIKDIRAMLGGGEKSIKDILKLELTAETHEIKEVIKQKEYEMKEAARKLDFETATILRDEIVL